MRSKTADAHIAEIEGFLDRFYVSGYEKSFSVYTYLKAEECTVAHADKIAEFYRPLLEEALELAKGERSLLECYNLTKRQISRFVEQIQSIVDDAVRYAGQLNESKPRKPRVRKEKSAEQLTKGFAFLPELPDLGIASQEPTKIIGASTVYLYNVKYKTLQVLLAEGQDGLTVRGSTVHGFGDKSFTKTVRRPEAIIPTIAHTGWASALDAASRLKTKEQRPTGRSNKDTVIVRVVRSG